VKRHFPGDPERKDPRYVRGAFYRPDSKAKVIWDVDKRVSPYPEHAPQPKDRVVERLWRDGEVEIAPTLVVFAHGALSTAKLDAATRRRLVEFLERPDPDLVIIEGEEWDEVVSMPLGPREPAWVVEPEPDQEPLGAAIEALQMKGISKREALEAMAEALRQWPLDEFPSLCGGSRRSRG
jgi:hypothetical protein